MLCGCSHLSVCEEYGALPCSLSWFGSWQRRDRHSCSVFGLYGCRGEQESQTLCPAVMSLGFNKSKWWQLCELRLSWLCWGLCSQDKQTLLQLPCCHAKGGLHQRSCLSWSAFWSPEPSCPVLLPAGLWAFMEVHPVPCVTPPCSFIL